MAGPTLIPFIFADVMRDWIRNRLNEYEGRHEHRDEEFAALVSSNLAALSNRRNLWTYILILACLNAFVWLSVIVFPQDIAEAWTTVTDINDRIAAVMIAIIFSIGMWLTYSLLRLKYQDIENPNFDGEFFASQRYSDHSVKRWRIWLFSVIGGVLNLILLLFTELYLVAG